MKKGYKVSYVVAEGQPLAEPAATLISRRDTGDVIQSAYDARTDEYLGKALFPVRPPHRLAEKPWREAMCRLAARIAIDGMPPQETRTDTLCRWLTDAMNVDGFQSATLDADIRRTIRFLLAEYEKLAAED